MNVYGTIASAKPARCLSVKILREINSLKFHQLPLIPCKIGAVRRFTAYRVKQLITDLTLIDDKIKLPCNSQISKYSYKFYCFAIILIFISFPSFSSFVLFVPKLIYRFEFSSQSLTSYYNIVDGFLSYSQRHS